VEALRAAFQLNDAELVTGDHDFKQMEREIRWLK